MTTTRWSPFFKQLVVIAGLIGSIWLLFRIHAILGPLALAVLFAYVISLPVNRLERRTGWSRTLLAVIVLLSAIVLLVLAIVLVVPALYNLLVSFAVTLVSVITELLDVTPRPITITPELTFDLGPLYTPVNQWLRSVIQPDLTTIQNLQRYFFPVATGAASVVIGAVTSIFWIFFIVILVFILVRDGPRIRGAFLSRVPAAWRPELDRLMSELASVWNLFVQGQFVMNSVIGIIVWILMSILGVRNAPALGLLAAVMEFVPGIGLTTGGHPGRPDRPDPWLIMAAHPQPRVRHRRDPDLRVAGPGRKRLSDAAHCRPPDRLAPGHRHRGRSRRRRRSPVCWAFSWPRPPSPRYA